MKQATALYAFALAALVVIAATVLVILHNPVPSWFEALALGVGGGGLGIAVPHAVAAIAPAPPAPAPPAADDRLPS